MYRENSFSPDLAEFQQLEKRLEEAGEVSDDSGTGRSTGLGSLSSSAPRYKQIR